MAEGFPFKGKFVVDVWHRNKTRLAILALRKLMKDKNLSASDRLDAIRIYKELIMMGPTPPPIDKATVSASKEMREKILKLTNKAIARQPIPESMRWMGCPHDPKAIKGCDICNPEEKTS